MRRAHLNPVFLAFLAKGGIWTDAEVRRTLSDCHSEVGDASTSPGTPKVPSKPRQWERGCSRIPFSGSEESAPAQPDLERGLASCRLWAWECLLWKAPPHSPSKCTTPLPVHLSSLRGSLTQAGGGSFAIMAWCPPPGPQLISKPQTEGLCGGLFLWMTLKVKGHGHMPQLRPATRVQPCRLRAILGKCQTALFSSRGKRN